jgi:hypothetical protein
LGCQANRRTPELTRSTRADQSPVHKGFFRQHRPKAERQFSGDKKRKRTFDEHDSNIKLRPKGDGRVMPRSSKPACHRSIRPVASNSSRLRRCGFRRARAAACPPSTSETLRRRSRRRHRFASVRMRHCQSELAKIFRIQGTLNSGNQRSPPTPCMICTWSGLSAIARINQSRQPHASS